MKGEGERERAGRFFLFVVASLLSSSSSLTCEIQKNSKSDRGCYNDINSLPKQKKRKEAATRKREKREKSFSLALFLLLSTSASTSSASASALPLGKRRQDVEKHHEVDRDHRAPAGEHEAPGVVQLDAVAE